MTKNMGTADRAARAVLGIVLLALAFGPLAGILAWLAGAVGVVMLATSALGSCPLYTLFGIRTCKRT